MHVDLRESHLTSVDQARELLRLIAEHPDEPVISVSSHTATTNTLLVCDPGSQALECIHQETNWGVRHTRRWQGCIVARLRCAAAGGSLDEWSAGPAPTRCGNRQ